MSAGKLDKLVMVLSTDWFMPYWFTLAINIEGQERIPFQLGCREVVKQILCAVKEYWLTDFSDERVAKTRAMLHALLDKCHVSNYTKGKIVSLVEGHNFPRTDDATVSLMVAITEKLLQSPYEGAQLDPEVKETVANIWRMANPTSSSEADFETLCLSSRTDWDVFIRNTTPDLPTLLADYVSEVECRDQFERFWAAVNSNLSAGQRRTLVSWYRTVGESMTGERLRLPQEA